MIMKNNKEAGFIHKALLPKEYQQVEYIENQINAYIDTGYAPNYNNDIHIKIGFARTNAATGYRYCILSDYVTTSNYTTSIEINTSNAARFYRSGVVDATLGTVSVNDYNKMTVDYNSTTHNYNVTLNNDSVTGTMSSYNTGTDPNTMLLFVDQAKRFATFNKPLRIYGLKIAENGVLIRHMIPCYRKSDSVIGMYDRVNNVFYTNAGTQSLVKGNDVAPANIDKIYHGTDLVFEQGYIGEQTGVPPITTTRQTIGKNLKDYKIYGNTVQNGTPTPSSPVDVVSVGEKTSNLLDISKCTTDITGLNPIQNGIYVATNTTAGFYIPMNEMKKIFTSTGDYSISSRYIKGSQSSTPWRIYIDNNSSNVIRFNNGVASVTQQNLDDISNATNNSNIIIYSNLDGETNNAQITDFQIEKNSSATSYEPYGYKIPVEVSGKNLFDKNQTPIANYNDWLSADKTKFSRGRFNVATWSVDDVSLQTSNYFNSSVEAFAIPCNTREKFTIVFTGAKPTTPRYYYSHIVTAGNGYNVKARTAYTLTNDKATIEAEYNGWLVIEWGLDTNANDGIMIVKGDTTPNTYESYYEPKTTEIYLDEPLRKIGDYSDYIDFANGKVVRNIGERIFNGNETFSLNPSYNGFTTTQSNYIQDSSGFCTHCNVIGVHATGISCRIAYGLRFQGFASLYETATDFKAWLASEYNAGRPLTLDYPLATPTEEAITLPDIPTLKNATTIFSIDTQIQPSNMYIKYKGR